MVRLRHLMFIKAGKPRAPAREHSRGGQVTDDEKFTLRNAHHTRVITDPFPGKPIQPVFGLFGKLKGFKQREPQISVYAAYKKGFDDAVKIFQEAIDRFPN